MIRHLLKGSLASGLVALVALTATPAFSQTYAAPKASVTLSKAANLDLAGEGVAVVIADFPARAGLYLQQCKEVAPNVRPSAADCNSDAQLWISRIPGANFVPGALITMKLDSKFGVTDCAKDKCTVFVRYDHTAPADFSQDQAIAINFASLQQSLSVSRKGIKVGQSLALPKKTAEGANVTYRARDTKRCTVVGNVVTASKPGLCRVVATAPATADFSEFEETLRLTINK